jgi:hypothetical protein
VVGSIVSSKGKVLQSLWMGSSAKIGYRSII